MSEQHTKTPWYGKAEGKFQPSDWDATISTNEDCASAPIFDKNDEVVALVVECGDGVLFDCAKLKANARRIVASVNRLAQFRVEDIENPAIDLTGFNSALEGKLRAEKQRDELLAALKVADNMLFLEGYGENSSTRKQNLAAIAKAEQ